jgi:hypothetical protein
MTLTHNAVDRVQGPEVEGTLSVTTPIDTWQP